MRMQPCDVKSSDTLSRHAQQDYNMVADRTSPLLVFFLPHFFPHVFFIFFSLSFLRITTSKYRFETVDRNHGFNYTASFCPIRSFVVSLFPLRNTCFLSFFSIFFVSFISFRSIPRFIICFLLKGYLLFGIWIEFQKLISFFLFSIRYGLSSSKNF